MANIRPSWPLPKIPTAEFGKIIKNLREGSKGSDYARIL
jgi:hypothetical protein